MKYGYKQTTGFLPVCYWYETDVEHSNSPHQTLQNLANNVPAFPTTQKATSALLIYRTALV